MSHSRNLVRASSLAASRRSFCCRMMLSAISLYLLKALALQARVRKRSVLPDAVLGQETGASNLSIPADCGFAFAFAS